MKPGRGKQKGDKFQRLIAKHLTEFFKKEFVATPRSGGLRWKDIKNTRGDITTDWGDFPYCIECKCDESWTLDNFVSIPPKHPLRVWWGQACKDAKAIGKEPLLIFSKNHKPIYAVADFGHCSEEYGNYMILNLGTGTVIMLEFFEALKVIEDNGTFSNEKHKKRGT